MYFLFCCVQLGRAEKRIFRDVKLTVLYWAKLVCFKILYKNEIDLRLSPLTIVIGQFEMDM